MLKVRIGSEGTKIDVLPVKHGHFGPFYNYTLSLSFDVDLMVALVPWQSSRAPEKHTIQAKQGAR